MNKRDFFGLWPLLHPLPFTFSPSSFHFEPLLIFTGREGGITKAIPKYERLGSIHSHTNELFLLFAIVAGSSLAPFTYLLVR